MKETTLCYINKNNEYLFLLRNKKLQDPNEGKYIGVGGKIEEGETPLQCVIREVEEETSLRIRNPILRGEIYFYSDTYDDEKMYLFVADQYEGSVDYDCAEGELKWISRDNIMELNLWEGDRVFLKELLESEDYINLSLWYEGDKLVRLERECK